MSEAVTYLLYALLVVVLAMAGRYVGNMWNYPTTGLVVGGLVGAGLAYWHSQSDGTKYDY
jgi:hypothetical protein